MADDLLQSLERTRSGYAVECDHGLFLLDSFTGGGGYQGTIRQPEAGWWGAAASRYSPWRNVETYPRPRCYLDRYPREDWAKYDERRARAVLWNFIGPLTELKTSFALSTPPNYLGQPAALAHWRENVDGGGSAWEEIRPAVALAAAIFGWCPVVVDMEPTIEGESLAQARARGAGRPCVVPLTPANLVDYALDGASFRWAKIRTDHTAGAWDGEASSVTSYRIWTRSSVERFDVDASGSVTSHGIAPHPFGQVPIAVFRYAPVPGEFVRGLPMHAGPARAQRRLYNLLSELDEHMRSQVFAQLVIACKGGIGGELAIGTDNAIALDPDSRQEHYYLSPPAGVAAVYERRIESTIDHGIYRAARAEFSKPVITEAGTHRFDLAERSGGDFAGELARGERWMDAIAWAGLGGRPEELNGYSVTPAADQDADIASAIATTMQGLALKLGDTMSARLRMRLAQRLDPKMTPDVRAQVEREIVALSMGPARAARPRRQGAR